MDFYTNMNTLDIATYLAFICVQFIFTLFKRYTEDFTHFAVSSVHFEPFQFTFALKISFQVHKMRLQFHRAFALGAVYWFSAFWFTINSQCAIFLALSRSAQWPVPVGIKENNRSRQNFNSFHCLFLHCFEL